MMWISVKRERDRDIKRIFTYKNTGNEFKAWKSRLRFHLCK